MKTSTLLLIVTIVSTALHAGEVIATVDTTLVISKSTRYEKPHKSVIYKQTQQGDLSLHAWLPEGWDATDKRPAIVFIHGGGWATGAPGAFTHHASYFRTRGLVTFSIDYRIGSKHKTSPYECVADGRSAMRYVRSHAADWGIDPDRIVVSGGSAGGHVALCTAIFDTFDDPADDLKVSCKPNALVLFNPVVDTTRTGFGHKRVGANPEQLSPVHHVAGKLPPMILFNGDKDKAATIERARALVKAATAVDSRAELVTYPGQPHSFFNRGKSDGVYFADTVRRSDIFLASLGYLTGDPTISPAD